MLGRSLLLALVVVAVSACSADSPSGPSRNPLPGPPSPAPTPTLPPLAEGRYRLVVTAAGASMGCEIRTAGIPLGGLPPLAAGGFSQDALLRHGLDGWSIAPESSGGRTTLTLRVTGASWPASPVVTGSLAGRSDQRAYDGPAIDAGDGERPAAFTGAVVPGPVLVDGIVMTGTVTGRLMFSAAWTGQVTVCQAAQLLLQRP